MWKWNLSSHTNTCLSVHINTHSLREWHSYGILTGSRPGTGCRWRRSSSGSPFRPIYTRTWPQKRDTWQVGWTLSELGWQAGKYTESSPQTRQAGRTSPSLSVSCKHIHEGRERNFDKNAANLQDACSKTAFQETTDKNDVFTGAERALLVPADDQQTPAFCMLLYRLFHSHHKEKLLLRQENGV